MIIIKKITLLVILLLVIKTGFAQYDYLRISLEVIHSMQKQNSNIQFKLYQIDSLFLFSVKSIPIINDTRYSHTKTDTIYKKDSLIIYSVKSIPIIDDNKYLETKIDTIYIINREIFNEIAEIAINLSSEQIIRGTNPSNPSFGNDGTTFNLNLSVLFDDITYSIWCPDMNTNRRNLEPFLNLCKKIILLAKLNPKDVF